MKFYRRWQGVKALCFDLDDTLYDNHPVIKRAEQQLKTWLNHRLPATGNFNAADWQRFAEDTIRQNPWLQNHVTEKRRAVLTKVALHCGLSNSVAQHLAEDALEFFLAERSNFQVPAKAIKLLAALAKYYPLVAITNGNVDCDKLGLAPYFSLVLKAGFDGAAKPELDMFSQAQAYLNLPSSHILHIGDSLITDVAGAKRAGFQACWYNDQNKTIYSLHQASLLPDVEINDIEQLRRLLCFT